MAAGEGGVLGRPVAVDQPRRRQAAERLPDQLGSQHVAARQELADAGEAHQAGLVARLDHLLDGLMEQAGGQPEGGDPVRRDQLGQRAVRGRSRRRDHQAAAVEQRPPDLERRGIEGGRRELEEDLLGPEPDVVGALDQPHHGTVGHSHPLGHAGRAGGVHHIGQPISQSIGSQPVRDRSVGRRTVRLGRGSRQLGLQHPRPAGQERGTPRLQPVLGQQQRRAEVGEDGAQALVGPGRIDRHVGAAGPQHGEDRHDEVRRALRQERDGDLGAHPRPHQAPGEPPRRRFQLAVGEPRRARARGHRHRHRPRRAARLEHEQLGDGGLARVGAAGVVPLDHHLLAVRGAEPGEVRRGQRRGREARHRHLTEIPRRRSAPLRHRLCPSHRATRRRRPEHPEHPERGRRDRFPAGSRPRPRSSPRSAR